MQMKPVDTKREKTRKNLDLSIFGVWTKAVLFILIWFIFQGVAYSEETHFGSRETPAKKIENSLLDNFYRVSPTVYRSEQPGKRAFTYLQTFGIKSVLNLREFHTDRDEAGKTDIKLYHFPLATGKINEAQLIAALRLIRDAPKPILIHCWHGSDRTGIVCAMYRMVFEQWPREAAIEEFTRGPFGFHALVWTNLPELLRNIDVEAVRRAVFQLEEKVLK